MRNSILSIGSVYIDINCIDFPCGDGLIPEKEIVGEKYEVTMGGSALNFAKICEALELDPIVIGKIGKDEMGELIMKLIQKTRITPAFIVSEQAYTMLGLNFAGGNVSLMATVGSASRLLTFAEIEEKFDEYINQTDFLNLAGCFKFKALLPNYYKLAQKAQGAGIKVVLDHGRVTNAVTEEEKEIIKKLVAKTDYYLPSRDEFMSVWDGKNIEDTLCNVRKITKAIIAVKDGENGVFGMNENKIIKVPAYPVKVVNTVGAGDTFNAGFIKAQSLNLKFTESLLFGQAAAAIKISGDLPTLEKIKSLSA